MSILESYATSTPDGHDARNPFSSFFWRWFGPAAVLVAELAFFALAQTSRQSPGLFPALCGLAASAPAAEKPFLTENDAAMSRMMARMAITPSGNVDHDFVEMMVPHHEGAIAMAQAMLRHGENPALRRLAQEIIVTQQQEIAAMRLALGEPLPASIAAPDQPSDLTR
jgi:hypothetical protein